MARFSVGGYVGYEIRSRTGPGCEFRRRVLVVRWFGRSHAIWLRRIEGPGPAPDMVTIGLSIVFDDLMSGRSGGEFFRSRGGALVGPIAMPFVHAVKS